ncbi:MAG: LUD domain-containing protein [Anaerolineales bacterium]|nr:LUD domain-containing protein [Anaerolineales bacterium]
MTKSFHSQIREALQNPTLQGALDGNAERRLIARQQAYASLPQDLQVMRQRAHAVRAEVTTNLDRYLEQFIHRAQSNGMIVHQAASAAQAVEIVRQIARQSGAKLIAKSKTMVGEEIELNPALEADGLQVVETDLGEYIVQLRGEPPAHIITPAVHLTRHQVGETFQAKLGVPFTEDIPTLTAIARRILRQTFLSADIGISGVNFGVAESGALCTVTNEGNGRMVTTLPPIHIALMGIERLVPTLDDLALMLYLLPRSATGQKLSVYTSLIHGPRREGESDGALQRHLILLDNGRSALRLSPLAEALYCIRCGACLNACPVFREIGGHAYVGASGKHTPYPGPIGSVISAGLFGIQEFGNLARASSLCGACQEACPMDIDLDGLLLRVRAGQSAEQSAYLKNVPAGLKLGLRAFSWMAASPWRFGAAQSMAGIFSRLLSPISAWLRLPAFTGWGYRRDFPRPARRTFHSQFKPTGEAEMLSSVGPQAASQSQAQPVSTQPTEPEDLATRFEAELAALGGVFTRCKEPELAAHILDILKSRNIQTIQSWDGDQLPVGLLNALRAAGIQATTDPDPGLRAGLTGALAGIAETGTLILPGGPGRPLTASLLPEVHIAILKAADLQASLTSAVRSLPLGDYSSLVLVSGPSRTADIEMTLTIGVHGPGELFVLYCE